MVPGYTGPGRAVAVPLIISRLYLGPRTQATKNLGFEVYCRTVQLYVCYNPVFWSGTPEPQSITTWPSEYLNVVAFEFSKQALTSTFLRRQDERHARLSNTSVCEQLYKKCN